MNTIQEDVGQEEQPDNVRRALQENPVKRNGTNIPRATFNIIVHLDLNWFP